MAFSKNQVIKLFVPWFYIKGYISAPGGPSNYISIELLDTNLVPLSLEELCDLEQMYNHTDQYVYDMNNRLKSILWKVGGEGNPIKSSQAPLLSDVFLEMHCIQVIHRTLNKSNTYRMDDKKDKVKYLDPDWEKTTTELVYFKTIWPHWLLSRPFDPIYHCVPN